MSPVTTQVNSNELCGEALSPDRVLLAILVEIRIQFDPVSYLTMKILAVIFAFLAILAGSYAETIYASPSGGGNGNSAASPQTVSQAMSRLDPGDKLILLDGEYHETLDVSRSGAPGQYITIRAQNVGGAYFNGDGVRIPVIVYDRDYVHLDGIRAGNSHQHVYNVLYSDHIKITRCSG